VICCFVVAGFGLLVGRRCDSRLGPRHLSFGVRDRQDGIGGYYETFQASVM